MTGTTVRSRARNAALGAVIGGVAAGAVAIGVVFVANVSDPTGQSRLSEPLVQRAALLGAVVGAVVGAFRD
jgi:hypothetical protein